MITKLVYNNKAFDIQDEYNLESSNNEVTFNDITIDFTGYELKDLPLKYQEVKIKQSEKEEDILQGEVIFTGYVEEFSISDLHCKDVDISLTLTLLSPLKMATVRTATINGTYTMSDAITRILEPLTNDGFIIAEMNVPNTQILVSYIMQSIESVMNEICLKHNIFWYIDENKNIYVNSINYLFGKNVAKEITDTKKEKGLFGIEPSIESVDYANVINIKNARLIYKSEAVSEAYVINYDGFAFLTLPKTVKKGDSVELNYPVIISKEIAKQVLKENGDDTSLTLFEIAEGTNIYSIIYNATTDEFETTGSITYSDDEGDEGIIVLQRDSFFNNLITSFKYNGETDITIDTILSNTALRYIKMQFMYSREIEKLKGVISDSGQIEKTVDANETWYTLKELINYARSLIMQDTNKVNSIVLKYDIDPELKVGDIVDIELPKFFSEGKFAVTKIDYTYVSDLEQNWTITLQNSALLSSYIDIFRPKSSQETETQNSSLVISEFVEEGVNEVHELYTPEAEV